MRPHHVHKTNTAHHHHEAAMEMLRRHRRHEAELDGGEAFVPDNRYGFVPIDDGEVEACGEDFIARATSNEAADHELTREEMFPEGRAFVFDLFDEEPDPFDGGYN
jgi:hypothetical protein